MISYRLWRAWSPRQRNRKRLPRNQHRFPARTFTFEEVRGILADKSRSGYRAEVKAILTAHGVGKLSEITDPAELAAVAAEAEVIGNA